MTPEICNAKIKSTMLGQEDHGIFTAMIILDFGGSGQGFGGYDLRCGTSAFRFIDGVCQAVGAQQWENLTGMVCRVKGDAGPGISGNLLAIGHIIEDRWFDLDEFQKQSLAEHSS